MKFKLPDFRNWKALNSSPTSRTMAGTSRSSWTDIFKPITDIIGWAFGDLLKGFASWSMSKLASMFIAVKNFIWTFDWNISEESLLKALENQKLVWYEQLGETIGEGLGWVVCGLIPSASLLMFNKPMAYYVLSEVGEEAYDELVGSVGNLLKTTRLHKQNEAFTHLFIATRWLVKNAANDDSDTLLGGVIGKILDQFPKLKEGAKTWGDKGGKPWILSNKVEEAIENAPIGEEWKAFLEGLVEGFGDSCDEAIYAFANSYDSFLASQASIKAAENGQPNTVLITPNRLADDEQLILHGTPDQLRQQIPQALANYQLVHNRDIGFDLGTPLPDRAYKQISQFVLQIHWANKKAPPYGKGVKRHYVTVNSANKVKFDFEKIYKAAGGVTPYNFGNFIAIAQMSDGSELRIWAATKAEALDRVEALAELSTAEILTVNTTEELKKYKRDEIEGLAKSPYQIYPSHIFIIHKSKVFADYQKSQVSDTNPKATKQGYFKERKYKLSLWQGQKPVDWDDIIAEIFAPVPPTSSI